MFEYLRVLCLEHHLPQLHGVLTNYQDWIFLSYNLEEEVQKVHSLETTSSRVHYKKLQFDIGGTIRLRDDQLNLQEQQLGQIMRVI